MIDLRGGPRDGDTIDDFMGEVNFPEVFSHKMEPNTVYSIFGGDVRFVYHRYSRTGEYLGIRIPPVPMRWPDFDPFPRWTRLTRQLQRIRRLRLRLVDKDYEADY